MARYKVIGKTKHVKSFFVKDADGVLHQRQIVRGREIEVDEEEFTPLLQRLVNRKEVRLVEIEEEDPGMAFAVVDDGEAPDWETPEEEEVTEEEPEVTHEAPEVNIEEEDNSDSPTSRRGRGLKKKTEDEV